MKSFAFVVLAITAIANANTLAQSEDGIVKPRVGERLVTGSIVSAIRNAQKKIREAGMDPMIISDVNYHQSIIPVFLEARTFIQSMEVLGLSDIEIINIDFSTILRRLTIDLMLPEIYFSVGNSGASLVAFGSTAETNFKGFASVQQTRLKGTVRVNVGIISGISIRSLDLDFSIKRIESNLSFKFLSCDLSDTINTALNVDIPNYLIKNKNLINNLLENKVMELLKDIL